MSALKCESFVLHVPAQRQFASRGMRVTPLDTSLRLGRNLTTYMVMSDGNFLAVLNSSRIFLRYFLSSKVASVNNQVFTLEWLLRSGTNDWRVAVTALSD